MRRLLLLAMACAALAGCYSTNDATSALQAQGFTDIRVTGHAWFASCGKDDTFATSFTARNPQGRVVSGAVCSGLIFRNATIRW
jgi:hypothetical protein